MITTELSLPEKFMEIKKILAYLPRGMRSSPGYSGTAPPRARGSDAQAPLQEGALPFFGHIKVTGESQGL